MRRDVATSLLGWCIGAAMGLPLDPFLPLAAAIGLTDRVPVEARLALAALLAALSAPVYAETPMLTMLRFVATCGAAAALSSRYHDGGRSRGLALLGGLGVSALLTSLCGWPVAVSGPWAVLFFTLHTLLAEWER